MSRLKHIHLRPRK